MAEYDFVIVGGGTSGCVLASRLANSNGKPSVLLLEAGGSNIDASYLVPADRFSLAFTTPNLNWGYSTEPQTHLAGQRLNYARGKGLGGSTAINFSAWIVGAKDDFDEWAQLVGDDAFGWNQVQESLKKIENCHLEIPEEQRAFLKPKVEDHGSNGPVHVAYGHVHRKNVTDVFTAAEQCGLGANEDINSGNPLGMGMGAVTMYQGRRITASEAYLSNTPSNLMIELLSTVAKTILSDDTKSARGVITTDGREFFARQEVIICSGALNSPQILLLSGIGHPDELHRLGIPILVDHPQVGKNLLDHAASILTLLQKPGTNQWSCLAKDEMPGENEMSHLFMPSPMGWFKSEAVFQSAEFLALPRSLQSHLKKSTIPMFEICTHATMFPAGHGEVPPIDSYMTAVILFMNPLSVGSVDLKSTDPNAAPSMDPNILSHDFDRRVAIEAMRQSMDFLEAPVWQENIIGRVGWPSSRSDESIWEYIISTAFTSWHMCGTARMGTNKSAAVVDSDFRVFGVDNLRIVDLSVCPLIPNNHTQSTAYLMGEIAAQKMIREYGFGIEGSEI